MAIKRVWIEPGCIVCHMSEEGCPEVFHIPERSDTAMVREGVDFSKYEAKIKETAEACPVNVIKYE
jgi:ferredoxin